MTVCTQCGTQNQEGAKFCSNCRAVLTVTPSAQGSPVPTLGKQFGLIPVGNVLLGLVCLIYLINPGAGIIELVPDNIPLIGNLDEGAATIGLLMSLNNLGVINFKAEHWSEISPWLRRGKVK